MKQAKFREYLDKNLLKKYRFTVFFIVFIIFFSVPTFLTAQETELVKEDNAKAETALEIGEVTVTGTRGEKRLSDSPVVTEIISKEEIENSTASTLVDVLKNYGLVSVADSHGDNIMFQGLGGNQVLILIDGRPVIGRSSGFVDGESLPLNNVERIEIIRGPQSALYGSDGMAGVINIITAKPKDKLSLAASVTDKMLFSYDDPDTTQTVNALKYYDPLREQIASLIFDLPLEDVSTSLSVNAARGSKYYNEQRNATILPEYWRIAAGLNTQIDASEILNFHLGGNFMTMTSDDQTSSLGSLSRERVLRTDAYTEASWNPEDFMGFTLKAFGNYYERFTDSYAAVSKVWTTQNSWHYEHLVGAELFGSFELAKDNLLTAGFEFSTQGLKKYTLQDLPDNYVSQDREALVIQDEFYEQDVYSLVFGVRVERNSQYGFSAAPRVSGMLYLAPGFRLLGGVGVGYRAPDFISLYVTVDEQTVPGHPIILGNTELKPEYNIGANLGFEYSDKIVNLRLNTFYQEVFDLITTVEQDYLVNGLAVYEYQNIDRAFSFGASSENRVNFLEYLYVTLAYDLILAYDRSNLELQHSQPAHTGRAQFGIDTKDKGFKAYVNARLYSPLNEDSVTQAYKDIRFLLDFYASFAFSKEFSIALGIDNITSYINKVLGPEVGAEISVTLNLKL